MEQNKVKLVVALRDKNRRLTKENVKLTAQMRRLAKELIDVNIENALLLAGSDQISDTLSYHKKLEIILKGIQGIIMQSQNLLSSKDNGKLETIVILLNKLLRRFKPYNNFVSINKVINVLDGICASLDENSNEYKVLHDVVESIIKHTLIFI